MIAGFLHIQGSQPSGQMEECLQAPLRAHPSDIAGAGVFTVLWKWPKKIGRRNLNRA
jgi:hypothetical protein